MHLIYLCADSGVTAFGHRGSSSHVRQMLRAWVASGATVELLSAHASEEVPRGLSAVQFHRIEALSNRAASVATPAELARLVQAQDNVLSQVLATRIQAVSSRDLLVYERYSLWSSAGMRCAQEYGIPGVLEVNAPLIEEQLRYRVPVDRGVAESVARKAFAAALALVAVSEEVAQYLVEKYPEARGKTRIIPNGVDPTRFPNNLRSTRLAPPGVFTIAFVGSFQEWHGLRVLLDAFQLIAAKDPTLRLLLVGEGPERKQVTMTIATMGMSEQVVMTGAVGEDEIPRLLSSCDVAVAPYPVISPFYFSPLKLYEYMAAGLAVVASDIGQIARVIDHGVNGWLVPPGDAQALAAAIVRLRQAPELRQLLGTAARAQVRERHTWPRIVAEVATLVRKSTPLRANPRARRSVG